MLDNRNDDNEGMSDITEIQKTPNVEFDQNIQRKERGKTVKFQSNPDSLGNRDSVALNQNFFDDLRRNNMGDEYDENGNPTKMRGLTKIAELLEDFNNEEDFKVQMSERRKTLAATAKDPDQSTDPVNVDDEDGPNFVAFQQLVKESKQLLEDIKDIENERELRGGDADLASHVMSSDHTSSPQKKRANLDSEIAAANADETIKIRNSKDDSLLL